MRVALGADHAGFELKDHLLTWLAARGVAGLDCGVHGPESVDYPDQAAAVAALVSAGEADFGILVCGSGVGMAIAANKLPGVRAANCHELFVARLARAHNDANVLTLGARVVGRGLAEALVEAFLDTPYEAGRHARRIEKIGALERPAGRD
ncbi:MAG TPA: ribose 5-phosphate isomerase B [Thermoanaerobaculia bacterium]|nr:ribose 5-phosphate isomerase B [Thermoanaerobaculia bacterium]